MPTGPVESFQTVPSRDEGMAWRAAKERAQDRLRRASRALEQRGLDPAETEFQRGVIAALRDVLAAGENGRQG